MTIKETTDQIPRLRTVPRIQLAYDQDVHSTWPHVVKFSGGRSSALMLLGLLYGKQLRPSRGDVIVFNNTSVEHPATYQFAARCKRIAENRFNIPFFWTEFQTFEDARRGKWTRLPDYRMVKPQVYSRKCPDGYRCNGEVFEELVSWKQALPTRFARTCTEYLKLHTTAKFLEDWFGRSSSISDRSKVVTHRLGHWYEKSYIDPTSYGEREGIVKYHLAQPVHRSKQAFQEFTDAALTRLRNRDVITKSFDSKAELKGSDAIDFVSLIGLRADEPRRVARVLERNNAIQNSERLADGEYVYAPLYDDDKSKRDVLTFWAKQTWDLEISPDINLSNCTYCFMKGERTLREIAVRCENNGQNFQTAPESITWWANFEKRYARVVPSRHDPQSVTQFGFFGANRLEYKEIIETMNGTYNHVPAGALPCDCTD